MSKLVLVLALFSLVACGGKKSGSDDSDGGNNSAKSNYKVLDGDIEEDDDGNLTGSGKLVFNSSLGSTDSQKNFAIATSLEDGGSLVVHVFASNELADGVNFKFKRNGTKIEIDINGEKLVETISVSDNGSFSFEIDAHNNESPTHVIIESNGDEVYKNGSGSWGQGAGKYWGLTLEDATVSKASAGKAKHGH